MQLAPSRQTGLIIAAGTMLVAPGMDVIAKLLTSYHSPGQIVLGRFLGQTILLLPLVAWAGQWGRPKAGHLLAGACLAAALLCLNAALVVMPVANAIAIFFVEPLVLTLLSAAILKETIGWRRMTAVLVGLIGAMIVIRPNWEAFGPTALLPLGTALFFALYVIVNRVMTLGGQRLALQFWTGVFSSLVIGAACLVGDAAAVPSLALSALSMPTIWLFAGMGVLAVITHQLILYALSMMPASVLAPMQYVEIISATLLGWLVFSDFPDALTWLGAAIIIGSGVYVFHRERQVKEEGS
ncbi:MAG: DMT family transporter [Pseudomonadota bacterium]